MISLCQTRLRVCWLNGYSGQMTGAWLLIVAVALWLPSFCTFCAASPDGTKSEWQSSLNSAWFLYNSKQLHRGYAQSDPNKLSIPVFFQSPTLSNSLGSCGYSTSHQVIEAAKLMLKSILFQTEYFWPSRIWIAWIWNRGFTNWNRNCLGRVQCLADMGTWIRPLCEVGGCRLWFSRSSCNLLVSFSPCFQSTAFKSQAALTSIFKTLMLV